MQVSKDAKFIGAVVAASFGVLTASNLLAPRTATTPTITQTPGVSSPESAEPFEEPKVLTIQNGQVVGLPGVKIEASAPGVLTIRDFTCQDGHWWMEGLQAAQPSRTYTFRPTKPGYYFIPVSTKVTLVWGETAQKHLSGFTFQAFPLVGPPATVAPSGTNKATLARNPGQTTGRS